MEEVWKGARALREALEKTQMETTADEVPS